MFNHNISKILFFKIYLKKILRNKISVNYFRFAHSAEANRRLGGSEAWLHFCSRGSPRGLWEPPGGSWEVPGCSWEVYIFLKSFLKIAFLPPGASGALPGGSGRDFWWEGSVEIIYKYFDFLFRGGSRRLREAPGRKAMSKLCVNHFKIFY